MTENDIQPIQDYSFINPPKSYCPRVVWHWTSANQNKTGITSNLEGMAAAGIAGATFFSFPPSSPGSFCFGGSTVIDNPAAPQSP